MYGAAFICRVLHCSLVDDDAEEEDELCMEPRIYVDGPITMLPTDTEHLHTACAITML